jgi:hypothetical protein
MSGLPPSSVRLAKLRSVVAREGRMDVEIKDKVPDVKKGTPQASGIAARDAKVGNTTSRDMANGSAPERTVRKAMFLAIFAWTAIMPVALIFILLVRRGEGLLPNLPLMNLLQSTYAAAIINEVGSIWVLGLLCMLPSIVAAMRKHPFFIWILLFDLVVSGIALFTGWAFVLWVPVLGASLWTPGPRFHTTLGKMIPPR